MRSSARLAWIAGVMACTAACGSGSQNEFSDSGAGSDARADVTVGEGGADAAHDALVSDGDDDGACQLPVDTQVLACNECLQASCCDAFVACAEDAECASLNDCNVACGAGALPNDGGPFDANADGSVKSCSDSCATAHASGASKYAAQQKCATDHCGPGADDGGGGSGACTL